MARRYFSTQEDDANKPVHVTAKKRGTITGRAGIFHFDPDGRDPLARSRTVPPEVAEEARRKGLVEVGGTTAEQPEDFDADGVVRRDGVEQHRISTVGASRRATSIQNDGEETRAGEYFGLSGADTRDTTAFPSDPSKTARVSTNRVIAVGDEPADDADDQDEQDGDEADGDDNDGGDDQFDAALDRLAPARADDDATQQEGSAPGGDAPPIGETDGEVNEHAGSDRGVGGDATDPTGQPTDQTDEETKVVANEGGAAAPAAAPKPRRARKSAGE